MENKADFLTQITQLDAFECGDIVAFDHHMAACWSFQQIDGAHQSGFASSGKTHDAKNLAFFHADVHMLDRFDGSPAFMKSHRHVVEFNNAHGSFLASFEYLFKFVQYVLFDESCLYIRPV